MHAVDPNADHIVVLGRRVFRIFLGRQHELKGHEVANGAKIDIDIGRIISSRARYRVELAVVVDPGRIRPGAGIAVGIAV